jgi:serine phosphatase RsbU (regulator of sigma subunit)
MVVVIDRGTQVLLAVIDATGHGPGAHALALDLAARLRSGFEASDDPGDVAVLLHDLHQASIGTAGAAAGLCVLDTERALLRYLAVGNVRAAVLGSERFTGVSRDGVLGRRWPTPFVQQATLRRGDHLLVWTDGLPEALARHLAHRLEAAESTGPAETVDLADELLQSHGKPHDDAACLVARWRG